MSLRERQMETGIEILVDRATCRSGQAGGSLLFRSELRSVVVGMRSRSSACDPAIGSIQAPIVGWSASTILGSKTSNPGCAGGV